jgi:hypothetical protein
MKKYLFFLFCIASTCLIQIHAFSQLPGGQYKLELSVPLIYNKTTIYNIFSGARATYLSGSAISKGLNINYQKKVTGNFFLLAGLGLFTQQFGIERPLNYDDPTNLLFYTKWYKYYTFQLTGGIGYEKHVSNRYSFRTIVSYNSLETYKQNYKTLYSSNAATQETQISHAKYHFGEMLNIQPGISMLLYKNVECGVDLLIPCYTRYRKDQTFDEDPDEYYHSTFSLGLNLHLSLLF